MNGSAERLTRFLRTDEVDPAVVTRLLARARELERAPISDALRGQVLGLLFLNPSLRTLASMQAGMSQLGGSSFVIQPGAGSWAIETELGITMDGDRPEHLREAIPVLSEYCNALGVRSFGDAVDLASDLNEPLLSQIDGLTNKPLINLESTTSHPCQSLADWKTLDDLEIPTDGKFVLSWAWHPKPLPLAVAASTLTMAAQRGMDVTLLRPDGYGLPTALMERASAAAAQSGGKLTETSDQADALEGAHVVYAKSWGAPRHYGDPGSEATLRAELRSWCIDESWFATARSDASFLHCLPVRRNVVVADEVLDGPRSRVVQQAGNRLHVQKSVLLEMLGD